MRLRHYFRLLRLHKPIGILLLWWPTAWALWLASEGKPPSLLILLFLLGTVCMRSAGCVINDIADRHVDLHVERTKTRPLTAGHVTLMEAFGLLFLLLLLALFVLLQLPRQCFYYALLAVVVTLLYPFCKRFIQSPQLILGIAFSMGIPMAYAALDHNLDKTMMLLLFINFMWVVTYDTEYAMVDRDDDLRIGVKSTAILFASYDKLVIALLQISLHLLWLPLVITLNSSFFWGCWIYAALNLAYQQRLISKREPVNCLNAFTSNNWYGLTMWLGLMGAMWN
ncbi:4-hydroxybenzoate octaprenyltransferase [Legionella jamestowniensis]|uniref:4-hydroxybenzoate octaprenyltransferase n=1 Tax=Legionella jamestowniensis TaxID=455 RepID=A0A0W0UU87_9GAMM|nr:4-hydroxybenzoate octaprenyltransferase [Legionella jamestowniensis]KTD11419.1 4-hydroxybenzoate polyprenyltransferase [Legionella jamestowniensis]SFL67573.1 4-hydroxybenzoate polyprenyltransferase [Legionella jamestowniensis DSM 19215]